MKTLTMICASGLLALGLTGCAYEQHAYRDNSGHRAVEESFHIGGAVGHYDHHPVHHRQHVVHHNPAPYCPPPVRHHGHHGHYRHHRYHHHH